MVQPCSPKPQTFPATMMCSVKLLISDPSKGCATLNQVITVRRGIRHGAAKREQDLTARMEVSLGSPETKSYNLGLKEEESKGSVNDSN